MFHEPGEVLVRIGAALTLDLLKSGRVDPEPFVSGVRPLEEVVAALKSHGRQEGIEYEILP